MSRFAPVAPEVPVLLVAPSVPQRGSLVTVFSGELEIAPAASLGRSAVLAVLRPFADFGLAVESSPEAEFGLRAFGPLPAVLGALAALHEFGEAVAVAAFVDQAGRLRRV